jgi:hypothetical protein
MSSPNKQNSGERDIGQQPYHILLIWGLQPHIPAGTIAKIIYYIPDPSLTYCPELLRRVILIRDVGSWASRCFAFLQYDSISVSIHFLFLNSTCWWFTVFSMIYTTDFYQIWLGARHCVRLAPWPHPRIWPAPSRGGSAHKVSLTPCAHLPPTRIVGLTTNCNLQWSRCHAYQADPKRISPAPVLNPQPANDQQHPCKTQGGRVSLHHWGLIFSIPRISRVIFQIKVDFTLEKRTRHFFEKFYFAHLLCV